MADENRPGPGGAEQFVTTRWSLVRAAHQGSPDVARAALETLCCQYWFPLYAYARRRGATPEEAEDDTQGFFADLLARGDWARADPQRGRFRAYLLGAFQHYLSHRLAHDRALKRGGGRATLSLDAGDAEQRYTSEPAAVTATPERLFARRWALELLDHVREQLRREYTQLGQERLFAALQPALTGEPSEESLTVLAGQLGMTVGALKVARHRLRQRFGRTLRDEVAQTVEHPGEVDDEIRELFAALQA